MDSVSKQEEEDEPKVNGKIFLQKKKLTYLWLADFDYIFKGKIVSPTFSFYSDQLSCYLTVRSAEKDFLDLIVMLRDNSPTDEIKKIFVEISILNRTRDKSICSKTTDDSRKNSKDHQFIFPNFVKMDQIVNQKGFLIEGYLMIEFNIQICSTNNYDPTHKSKKLNSFGELFESEKFSDIKFIVENKEFKLHKCILSARSRVFSAMFEHNMRESKENVVKIDGISYDVMKELFRFIYSEKVENLETLASDLLVAANKYELEDLKSLCEKVLIKNLSTNNVIDLYVLADHHQAGELKSYVCEFLSKNAKDVLSMDEFTQGLTSLPPIYKDMFNLLQRKI